MAAPPEKTIRDLDGRWVLNSKLSNDFDPILQLQSIGWLLRKAISYATITLDATHYEDPAPESAFHLDISTTVTGGIKTTVEKRVLDWTYREHADNIFGNLKGRSRLVKLHDVEDDVGGDGWIKQGWEEAGGEFLESWVKNEEYGWTAHQIWGFDVKDKGERKYVRRIVVRKGDEVKNARMVYDYLGKAAPQAKEDDGLAYE